MQTVQIVFDEELLRAADRAARRVRVNRSAFVREALRQYLKRIETRELELRDRKGYLRRPVTGGDVSEWEQVAAWPQD
ncbi:MAG: ribbon-helix-helix protein, CopG family [Acidobacteria bacterium]|nr:ribbon-helix-helix protein, CopG family [Acidobacteriota bacterium]